MQKSRSSLSQQSLHSQRGDFPTVSGGSGGLEARTYENYVKAIYELSTKGVIQAGATKTPMSDDMVKQPSGDSGDISLPPRLSEDRQAHAEPMLAHPSQPIHPNLLAAKLSVHVSAVYLMIKKLTQYGWVQFQPYKGIFLTESGQALAVKLLRRHRLWESFLQAKLGYDWTEIHDLAEELEHIGNEELINRLERFLDFPTADPHGDPIPDSQGRIDTSMGTPIALSELKIGECGRISRVLVSHDEFLRYLKETNLILGVTVCMEAQSNFDFSYRIRIVEENRIEENKIEREKMATKNGADKPVMPTPAYAEEKDTALKKSFYLTQQAAQALLVIKI